MSDVIVVNKRESEHYYYFNKMNGLSIRAEYPGGNEPFFAVEGPELLDISITNYCEKECDFCYRNSSSNGKHMDLNDYESILKQLKDTYTYQIAIGGGNPNQHPDFIEILRMTREDYDIVPSYTTNGTGLTDEIIQASQKYCGAVAVSYYEPLEDFKEAVRKLIDARIKTNVHFLLTSESIKRAIQVLEHPPEYLHGINAIIFLNYKPVGAGSDNRLLLKNSNLINKFFLSVKKHDLKKFKVGFDSCTISGIVKNLNYNQRFIDRCEAGRFSAFISEDMKLFPCSFMVNSTNGIDLKTTRIIDGWQLNEEFIKVRMMVQDNRCKTQCEYEYVCSGGCPIFVDINLCH